MPRVFSIGSAGVDQAEDASNEARIKPWKRRMSLLVFSPKGPKCSEPIHSYHLGKTGTTIGKFVSAGENMKPIMHHTSPELSHGSERNCRRQALSPCVSFITPPARQKLFGVRPGRSLRLKPEGGAGIHKQVLRIRFLRLASHADGGAQPSWSLSIGLCHFSGTSISDSPPATGRGTGGTPR